MILWQGESLIDGAPIIVIGTEHSANRKTGPLWQTWIMRSDMHPTEAVAVGADVAVCGNCALRAGAGCYVRTGQAPGSIFKKFLRGGYKLADSKARLQWARGRKVRVGAYGDPAAVPAEVWEEILSGTAGYTGYSHQWDHPSRVVRENAKKLQKIVMASVESLLDAHRARAAGFRTFRVASSPVRAPGEALCPASAEAGKILSCADCMACNPSRDLNAAGIVIKAHGIGARRVACD